jgi:thioredoxin-like negative regulator of GroEL
MTPTMEQVKKHIPVNMVNADYEDVIGKYNVRNIPATILVENNQESRRFIGTKSLNQILSWANNG